MNETILEYPLESIQPNYDQYEGGALHELALFAGAGGGLLGTKLLGWRAVCYVEWNNYCIEVLKARIKDGYLDDAPIWDDVSTFDGRPWREKVDVITAGFPCQPFSVAGKRKGATDDRNKWPDTIRIIREVRPQYILLENVSALLANEYIRTIFGDLAESGYNCRWDRIRASDVGAPHRRERLWIVAAMVNADNNGFIDTEERGGSYAGGNNNTTGKSEASESQGSSIKREFMADPASINGKRCIAERDNGRQPKGAIRDRSTTMADPQ